ncbi:DUF3238 domain-containing protein [Paenibacillus sanfengchensis]|uniref:DUF3238 domain-containing protein n=1 Tax=Paenibacillus sanfengchensis TaxID=3119819 RepID=UPI002FE0641A
MKDVRNFILSLLLFSMFIVLPTSAKANNEPPLKISTFSNYIELNVNNNGSKIIVSNIDEENSVSYEGYDSEIILNDLIPDTLYRYKVTLLNEENSEEYFYFSTHTPVSGSSNKINSVDLSDSNLNLSADAIVSKNQVLLSWEEVPGVQEYQIYKDSELIATVNNTQYIDNENFKNAYTTYEIQFFIPLSEEKKEELKLFYEVSNNPLSDEKLKEIAQKPYSIIKVVDSTIVDPDLQLAAINNSFKWTYKTFIPLQYAEDPWYNFETWGDGIKYFKGDNRSFSSTSEAYRTKTVGDTIFYTDSTTASENFFKDVSKTYAYDEDYVLVGSKQDSGAYINRIVNSTSASKVDVTVYHKSGNPYAVKGAEIDYQMRVITQKGGAYSFQGVHDRAPSHELYVRLSNGTVLTIFNHAHEGFEYLGAPSTLARSFSVSN